MLRARGAGHPLVENLPRMPQHVVGDDCVSLGARVERAAEQRRIGWLQDVEGRNPLAV